MGVSNDESNTPPKWILRFLRSLLKPELFEEVTGDLEERYQDNLTTFGTKKARLLFLIDAIKCIQPKLIKGIKSAFRMQQSGLLPHYWVTGYRNLFRKKVTTGITVFGLVVGIGAFLTILQYVYFELSYDQFHTNHENIYRVVIEESNSNTREMYPDGIGYGFAPAALSEIPEIRQYVRKNHVNRTATVTNVSSQSVFYEEINDLHFVDPSFFKVFNFPFLEGDANSAFEDKHSIVITEEMAAKYFTGENPIGKTLHLGGPPSPGNYTVTGVLEDPPLNSHLQFHFLMPMANYLEHGWGGAVKRNGDWNGFEVVSYFVIEEEADLHEVKHKLDKLIAQHAEGGQERETDIVKEVILQPVSDVYLKSEEFDYPGHFNETGNLDNIILFAIISLFVILIGWINYVNLATARSIERMREVALRKTMGAFKRQLVTQFLFEALVVNFLAAILAIGLSYVLLPVLNHILHKELEMQLFYIPEFWLSFLAVLFVGSMLSGLYPAFVLSGFQPIRGLKGQVAQTNKFGLRQGLIVFQFLTSISLIASSYLIFRQTEFMKNQKLTVDLDQILIVKGPRVVKSQEEGITRFKTFREELPAHHAIHAVSGSLCVPGEFWVGGLRRNLQIPVSEAPHGRGFYATVGFEQTYGLEFLAGQPLSEAFPDEETIIINESALETYGFESAQEAINQKLIGEEVESVKKIVGVVKDFHWHSLREAHKPYAIELYERRLTENISIRMNTSDAAATIAHIEEKFQEYFPGNPFDYYFADVAFNQKYKQEDQLGKVMIAFSVLAILVACIGLFALVSNAVNLRVKEIGIRKVLGASVRNLMALISSDFIKLLLLATLLTIPFIWWGASWWLQNYAYRIPISLDLFLFPALILLTISMLTVGHKTLLSATTNPIESLRDE